MDALYPPLFAVGDHVTIIETDQSCEVIHAQWRDGEWQYIVDRPHSGGSSIRQTFSQSSLFEWMPK